MPTPPSGPRRWFRRWLTLLPFETRRDYGREMEDVFIAEHLERADDGPAAVRTLRAETIGGLFAFARREQWSATRDDLRHAVRGWRRSPGLFAVLAATVCAGVAGVTVAFAVVDAVLLRPLPVPDPATLVRLGESHPDSPILSNMTYATFLDLESGGQGFDRVAASRFWFGNLTGDGTPERLTGALVSGAYFDALGVRPARGRLLTTDDDQPGHDDVVVISDGLWRRRFGAAGTVVGRRIQLNGQSMEVVGVLPPGAEFPLDTEVWTPLVARGSGLEQNRRFHGLQVVARLTSGTSLATVRVELDVHATAIEQGFPGADPDLRLTAAPVLDRIVAPVRMTLWTTLAATLTLLVVLGMNVAHVQLARAAGREREFAVRVALGASRWRIARLLLTESVALAMLAGTLGLLVAWLVVDVLPAMLPAGLPRVADVVFDWRAAGLGLIVAAATGIGFGAWPAMRSAGLDQLGAWRAQLGSASSGRVLAGTQLAMTFALVVLAALVVRSAVEVGKLPLGFSSDRLLRVDLSLSSDRISDSSDGDAYVAVLDPILRRIEAIPGVEATGLTTTAPFGSGAATSFSVVGNAVSESREPLADIRIVDPGFFAVLDVPLLAGRILTVDDRASSRPVMVVSETLAREHFGGENPVGRSITMLNWGPPLTAEVVGVVGDLVGQELEAPVAPTIYWHYPQFPQVFVLTVFVKTSVDETTLVPDVQRAIWELEPNLPLPRIEPMAAAVSAVRAQRRTLTWLLGGLAATAVLFALVGLYGVLAHKAAREQPAYGLRLALGARPIDIASLVAREAATVGVGGLVAGAGLALVSGRLVEGLLFRTTVNDVGAFAGALGLVVIAVAVAALGPAWRASRVDPLTALRSE